MWVETEGNKSCNFKCPKGLSSEKNELMFPVVEVQEPDAAETLELEIKFQETIVKVGAMAADMMLNLDVDAQVQKGAKLYLTLVSDSTGRDVTFGTGFTAPVLSGTASKTNAVTFIYDGSTFIQAGAAIQLD